MSRYLTTSSITLRTQPRGEDDRVYTLYTSAVGLVDAVADGSQKVLSKLAGHLEPFGEVVVTLVSRGQAYKLSGAIARRRYRRITESGKTMVAAGACLRFTRQLLVSGHPEADTYSLLRDVLEQLNTPLSESAVCAAPMVYSLKLLAQLGFQPQLDHCGRCLAEIREGFFDVVAGSLRCLRCTKSSTAQFMRVDAATVAYLRAALVQPLPQALCMGISLSTLTAARELVEQFAEYHTEATRSPSLIRVASFA